MPSPLFRRKSVARIQADAAQGYGDGHDSGSMRRVLSVRDLTFFGIAAVIGTGVFTAIGSACFAGGPAVILLFVITAIACGFAAYCYAEFASAVPVSGSAYTYAYVAFGELLAWIIGWDLLMEYAIGNIAVAISWSQYFVRVLEGFHIHIPAWLTMDYFTAHAGFDKAVEKLNGGAALSALDGKLRNAHEAWLSAPTVGGLRMIMNVPALLITALITWVVYAGIKESKKANNLFVYIKLAIILLVIVAGAFYVQPTNWTPFMPNGFSGVMSGVSAVFFAYIGFDAISTTAEECRNPQRDLPRAMFNTLIICTVLYCILVLVLTGMTNYTLFESVADPLAFVFEAQNTPVGRLISGIVSVSAVFVIASVLLVYQLGQPRIWMSMSRDGLLPPIFSRIHPKYKTPSFATILTGIVVGVPALFMNLDVVIALTSIGTLFAFVLVCGGVLMMRGKPEFAKSKFKVPFIGSRWIAPLLFIGGLALVVMQSSKRLPDDALSIASRTPDRMVVVNNSDYRIETAAVAATGKYASENLLLEPIAPGDSQVLFQRLAVAINLAEADVNISDVRSAAFEQQAPGAAYYRSLFRAEGLPMLAFWLVVLAIVVLSVWKNLSLIPVLGLVSCFYLMAQESHTNWLRFLIWLGVGLVIYFLYGFRNSRLKRIGEPAAQISSTGISPE